MKPLRYFAPLAMLLLAGGANAQVFVDDYRDPYERDPYQYGEQQPYGYDERYAGRGRVIRCESVDNRQRHCSTGGAPARIVRQISRSPCIEGRTWASDQRGLWVSQGCRAEFQLVDGGHAFGDGAGYPDGRYDNYNRGYDDRTAYGYGGQSYGGGRAIRCESRDYGHQFCRVPGLRGADIVRQISKTRCQFNGNWGYNRDGVWVDRGCAAEFVIR